MAKKVVCPLCGKAAAETFAPFCSKRCSDLDLGKWLKGGYSVPVIEMDDLPDEFEDPESEVKN
jgi:endogenous inhibitor of DNA gyrase (YacG/DUF329 family)